MDGVRTYKVSRLIGMKVSAFQDRTAARDLYDLRFLAENFRGEFAESDTATIAIAVANPDALHARFQRAFADDDIPSEMASLWMRTSSSFPTASEEEILDVAREFVVDCAAALRTD